jgi:putative membrane protein insertion efficiency factor
MKTVFITIIRLYRYMISPLFPSSCRFTPTCSEYAIDAIITYGALKGAVLAARRVLRCHPFHEGGVDPVK